MKNITAPIKKTDLGNAVANLQDCLLFLLEKSPTIVPAIERPTLLAGLPVEWAAQRYGDITAKIVLLFQQTQTQFLLKLTGDVDEATAAALNGMLKPLGVFEATTDYHVKGLVQWVDGRLAAAAIVRAYDKDLRSEQVLGQAITDAAGNYDIAYSTSQFNRAEKKNADLIVRVLAPTGAILAASPVLFNAQPVETINVLLGGKVLLGPSEYTRIEADVKPVLDGVEVADLTDADIKFLSGETGWSQEFLGFYAAAAGLSRQTNLSTEVFYGFAREKLPTTLNLLLAQSADTQRRALEAAIRDNIIPASVGAMIDGVLDRLKQLVVQQAFAKPTEPGKTSLGDLLATALPDSKQQIEILTRYVNNTETIEEFWGGLRQDPVYAASVDELQFTLQLGALTANHLPLVTALKRMRAKQEFQNVRDLVRWEVEDWKTIVTGKRGTPGTSFPPEVPGADDEEKATNYASILTRMMRDAFPTAAVAHAVTGPKFEKLRAKADLTTFFKRYEDFDLRKTHVDTYLAEKRDGVPVDKGEKETFTQELKQLQRVHRLTPEYEQMSDLLGQNLHSAQAISRIGETAFVNRFGKDWGANQAKLVFANAAQTATTALMQLAEHSLAFNTIDIAVLGAAKGPPVPGMPNLETLFGSLDFCDCEHCRTVLSPAAYLVDILAFLKDRVSKVAGKSAKDILFQRRPDLGEIELTCENTNTPLPYVDLVNEILEDCVSPPAVPVARQTTGTVAELKANPQYLNLAAYEKLKAEVYPWSMPFHLASAETHAYLDHLGVPRYELMRAFQKLGTPPSPTDSAIAADELGLTTFEARIITGTPLTPARQPSEFWGYPAATPGTWLADAGLRTVRVFLDKSGLSYAEFAELLKTRFINPQPADPNLGIVILSVDPLDPGTCDTTKLRITNVPNNLSPAEFQRFLDRTHRFVRLRRRLGWTSRELDKAISALQGTVPNDQRLNAAFLLRLSHIQRLRGDLHLSVEQLLALWAPIDTDGEDSTYQTLFQNRTVLNPVDLAFQLIFQPADQTWVIAPGATISDHSVTVLAALGLSAADLAALTATELADDFLNLANLSKLYRVSLLAKGLKLSIRDTLTLKALTGIDPFDALNTGNTLRFVELASKVRECGFSLAELDYLLRHNVASFSAIAPTETNIASVLEAIRQGLQKVDDETTLTPDPTGDVTRKQMALLNWDSASIEEAIATLNDNVVYEAPLPSLQEGLVFLGPLQSKTSYDTAAQMLRFKGAMSAKDKDGLLALSANGNYQTAVQFLFDAPRRFVFAQLSPFQISASALFDTPVPVAERFAIVLETLLGRVRAQCQQSLVTQQLGDALKLDSNIAEQLLTRRINSTPDPTQRALVDFLAPAFALSDLQVQLTASGFPDQFRTFTRLHKVAMVIVKFKVTATELTWLFEYGPGTGWLDLNALPHTASSAPSGVLFAGWGRLVDLFRLRDQLPLGSSVLSDVFSAARANSPDETALLARLNVGANWNLDDLQFLDGSDGFNSPFPAAYKDELSLARLSACFVLMKKLGASAIQCFAWAKPDLTPLDAASAKQTAKAKYDEAQWLAIAPPLRDVVREQQRAALVAWLVANPDPAKSQTWRDANGLFEYFLIDVEMSPCQLTSRIKQAISSVQLFVQRCLMNLEPAVAANVQTDMHWREWRWMKNYRVWEANRKIFLYPENWIEPDLRDGKSPFFKDLESDLLQNEVTLETSEAALLTYVEKLDGVARLEIVGMYDQQEQDDRGNRVVDVLHVFGRTRNSPHLYHYRQRVDSSYWTPWEKVDLDIEGDHLIPVVWNRRLCVFWPIFTEKTRKDTSPGAGPDDQIKFWEIQIAWSEFKNKKWTAKRISKAVVETASAGSGSNVLPKTQFTFKGLLTAGDLAIRIYTYFMTRSERITALNETRAGEGRGSGSSFPLDRPYAEFKFAGCNSEPAVVSESALTNVAPLVVPLGSSPANMHFVEAWRNPNSGKGDGTAVWPDLEKPLNLVEGNFPLDLVPGSAGAFESSRQNILTLNKTPGVFNLLTAHQDRQFTAQRPFFFQDDRRAFFVSPEAEQRPLFWSQPGQVRFESVAPIPSYYQQPVAVRSPVTTPAPGDLAVAEPTQGGELVAVAAGQFAQVDVLPRYRSQKKYRFQTFYHPYVCPLLRELHRNGIDGLLQRPAQITPEQFLVPPQAFNFNITYQPEPVVAQPYPVEDVDFSNSGAYSSYNWELFFHVPLLIADRLSKNQRFEESQRWFHYIFDPTDTSGHPAPQKFWRTRRFFETSTAQYRNEQIQQMLQRLASGTSDPEVDDQIKQWRQHPFNPHLIARMRTTAYQKSVVMKYLDNLIAWGDNLFRRDTIETINEATQLYVLAADILGRRPESIKPRVTPPARTFNTLEPLLDHFSNALVQVENVVAVVPNTGTGSVVVAAPPPLSLPSTLYFCVPKNEKLLGYWDSVADRLFKIRHCMNIEGVVRQLPLFEPPIDPALLVRAAAAGLDISSALNDINAALPHYRFNVMAQKAGEVCAELKGLGGALLAALEKRDAEAVSLLRSVQEMKVLNAVRQVRQRQVDEARESLEAAKKSREVVVIRHDYYANIQFLNTGEKVHLALSGAGLILQLGSADVNLVASLLALIPNFKLALPTSFGTTFGGDNLSKSIAAFGNHIGAMANLLHTKAGLSATLGGYQRRADDWKLQERMAAKELEQFDKQILAAEIRLAIAELELRNHDLQVENAHEMDAFMHDKFTNRELYDWMVSQISGIYFQSYQLTYDLAKRAERAYRFELGLADSNFIQFGYWDSLRKGLLAGERLSHDLKRMEAAYLDLNRREYELTKQISLLLIDPVALLRLKETGECFVDLPEALFDLDFPSHYLRRIKSMSLTIPCVTGPYTGVHATLTLVQNSVRRTTTGAPYERNVNGDSRFTDSLGTIQSIATSTGQNDSGLFELNFRDERYLPFEGAGAISQWRIELPKLSNQFDFNTIADVVLHLKYTARDGGETLRTAAQQTLASASGDLVRLFSMKHEFPTEWQRFLHPPETQPDQSVPLMLTPNHFPFQLPGKMITINEVELFLKVSKPDAYTTPLKLSFAPTGQVQEVSLVKDPNLKDLPRGTKTFNASLGAWTLTAKSADIPASLNLPVTAPARLNPEAIEDLWILCHYECQ